MCQVVALFKHPKFFRSAILALLVMGSSAEAVVVDTETTSPGKSADLIQTMEDEASQTVDTLNELKDAYQERENTLKEIEKQLVFYYATGAKCNETLRRIDLLERQAVELKKNRLSLESIQLQTLSN